MIKKAVSIFLCVFWLGFIFYNSSNDGFSSNKRSNGLVKIMENEYNNINSSEKSNKNNETEKQKNKQEHISKEVKKNSNIVEKKQYMNVFIRKNAHAFEYFVLAILISNLFVIFKCKLKKSIIYVLFIGLFYAVTDEFHQSFVSGRSSSVGDILIDFTGVVLGTALFYLIMKENKRRNDYVKR